MDSKRIIKNFAQSVVGKTITVGIEFGDHKIVLPNYDLVVEKVIKEVIWPLNLQIKQGLVHKIRPAKWYGISRNFKTFECVEDFLSAVEETVYKNKDTRDDGPSWLDGTLRNYETFYGKQLRVPRWYEIEDKYYLKK